VQPSRLAGVGVFALLVAVQAAFLMLLDQRAPDVTRSLRTVPIGGLRDGVRLSQTFDIGYGGLAGVEIAGETPPVSTTRYVDVRVAGPEGGDGVTRLATVTIPPGQTTCCRIAFPRIPASGRRFRLDLGFRGFDRNAPLTLRAGVVRIQGGLRINDRTQLLNLAMQPDGAIEHVPGAIRIPLVWFGAALLALDGLVSLAIPIACRPRRP
jgi:hypothetical protein